MMWKYLAAAILLTGLGVSQSNAEEKKTTIGEYLQHLKEVYGDSGEIIAGTVNGKTQSGHIITDIYPSPDPSTPFFNTPIPLSLSIQEAPCDSSQVITRPTSGAFSYPWCAKYQVISGTSYEAKRDTMYYSGGRWTYVVSTRFDCQNSSDLAQMPSSVRLAVCN